jgi:hypothetical protein
MNYFHNVDERRRLNSQANIYINKTSEDANLTFNDLKEMAKSRGDPKLFAMEKKMQRYAANILGSNAYMAQRKKELVSLMEVEGMPTVWFTLTLASHYWEDLHRLFGDPPPFFDESEEDYEKRWKSECLKNYASNPHIVDEFFVRRVKSFVEALFGADGLSACWTWYRFEWQKRGNIHCHGMVRLKSDPGLTKLAEKVARGRTAGRMLRRNFEVMRHRNQTCSYAYPDVYEQDILLKYIDEALYETLQETPLNDTQIQELLHDVEQGKKAEICICIYRDYMLTSLNPEPPDDACEEERDSMGPTPKVGDHVCSKCHKNADGSHGLLGDDIYIQLLTWCQRHKHTVSYCLRCGECRFDFPRELSRRTFLRVRERPYKRHETLKGKLRQTVVELFLKQMTDGLIVIARLQ